MSPAEAQNIVIHRTFIHFNEKAIIFNQMIMCEKFTRLQNMVWGMKVPAFSVGVSVDLDGGNDGNHIELV